MEKQICSVCQKPKAQLSCGVCACSLCKNCTSFLDEDTFSFLTHTPKNLRHQVYCATCFSSEVESHLNEYNQTVLQAKEILIFDKTQSKETRLIKRVEEKYEIKDCTDRDELIMKMAFRAVRSKYNAVIDVEIIPEKLRTGSYQTMRWSGSGTPAHVETKKLIKDRSFWSTPN